MLIAGAFEKLRPRLPFIRRDRSFKYPITMQSASGFHHKWIGERQFATETLHVSPRLNDVTIRLARSTIDIEPVALEVPDIRALAAARLLGRAAAVVDVDPFRRVHLEGVGLGFDVRFVEGLMGYS
jgi:hypothetical protein